MASKKKPPMRHQLDSGEWEIPSREVPLEKSARHRKRRGRKVLVGTAVLLLAGAGGAGFFLMKERDEARARAAALQTQVRSLEDALELHRTSKLELDSQLASCEETSAVKVGELEECQTERSGLAEQADEVARRVAELDALTGRFQAMIDTGDLSIKMRRGKMVLQMPSAVLFPSGSAKMSERGQKTVEKVAEILASEPKRKFTVAGHTDNVPIKGEYQSNWELSAARAVTVTEALIASGVKPHNLVAAGYGQYAPIATNGSARGRQLNRRIEIILEPDLAKLPIKQLAKQRSSQDKKQAR